MSFNPQQRSGSDSLSDYPNLKLVINYGILPQFGNKSGHVIFVNGEPKSMLAALEANMDDPIISTHTVAMHVRYLNSARRTRGNPSPMKHLKLLTIILTMLHKYSSDVKIVRLLAQIPPILSVEWKRVSTVNIIEKNGGLKFLLYLWTQHIADLTTLPYLARFLAKLPYTESAIKDLLGPVIDGLLYHLDADCAQLLPIVELLDALFRADKSYGSAARAQELLPVVIELAAPLVNSTSDTVKQLEAFVKAIYSLCGALIKYSETTADARTQGYKTTMSDYLDKTKSNAWLQQREELSSLLENAPQPEPEPAPRRVPKPRYPTRQAYEAEEKKKERKEEYGEREKKTQSPLQEPASKRLASTLPDRIIQSLALLRKLPDNAAAPVFPAGPTEKIRRSESHIPEEEQLELQEGGKARNKRVHKARKETKASMRPLLNQLDTMWPAFFPATKVTASGSGGGSRNKRAKNSRKGKAQPLFTVGMGPMPTAKQSQTAPPPAPCPGRSGLVYLHSGTDFPKDLQYRLVTKAALFILRRQRQYVQQYSRNLESAKQEPQAEKAKETETEQEEKEKEKETEKETEKGTSHSGSMMVCVLTQQQIVALLYHLQRTIGKHYKNPHGTPVPQPQPQPQSQPQPSQAPKAAAPTAKGAKGAKAAKSATQVQQQQRKGGGKQAKTTAKQPAKQKNK
eukprot:TRINITY_DN171_c2_g1_i1.p1 TRINITY_DN171_c2_g1~~TRINITY_DN171_c2_g1_i1.p1  ORF type:complete len:683 (-),score=130.08 TRINITY_DN171_c2_g1_i1:24-2072(-)